MPGPQIRFQRATVRLSTPAGALVLTGNGEIDDDRVKLLNLTLNAPRLAAGPMTAERVAGTLTATGDQRLRAQLSLSASEVASGDAKAQGFTLTLNADAPYGDDASLAGPLTAGAVARADSLEGAGWAGEAATARLDLSGALAGTLAAPRYRGVVALAVDAPQAQGPGVSLGKAGLTLASQTFDLAYDKAGLSASGPMAGRAFAATGAADVAGRRLTLSNFNLRGSGKAALTPTGFTGDLTAAADGRGGFGAADARALAETVFPSTLDPASNAALRKGLGRLTLSVPQVDLGITADGARLAVARPARLSFDGGALTVASARAAVGAQATTGAARVNLAAADLPRLDLAVSRYSATASGLAASGRLSVEGALFGLRGAELAPDLRLTQTGQTLQISLTGCTPFSVAAYGAPDAIVNGAKGALCPAQRPLIAARGGGWRSAVRLSGVEAALPTAPAALSEGAATIDIQGAGGGPLRGDITLNEGRVTDTAETIRFAPLKVSGRFALNGDVISGEVGAGPSAPVATVQITHDIARGAGSAVLAPTALAFVPEGLQPVQFSPAAALLTKVSGTAQASANIAWTREALDGAASISTEGLDMTTPAGRLMGVKGGVEFTSLVPTLVTAPDQRLTAERLEAVTPLTDLDLRFSMTGDAISLGAASATLAKGTASLDPMTVSLLPNAPLSGTLRLAGVDLGEIVAGFNLSDSVTIEANIDAALPFNLSPEGLRFKEGRIAATGPGRLSIKRAALTGVAASAAPTAPGAPPPAPTQVNAVQDFAYQALENLAFDSLDATVNSLPEGRLGVVFHVNGRNDPPERQQARIKLLDLLRGTAFDKPIPLPSNTPVDLTLDTSLNFDDLMAAYSRIGRSDAVQP